MLTLSSDVFMDSVNRDVSMEMMVGESFCRVCSDEADMRHRSNLPGVLVASNSYSVGLFPHFRSLQASLRKFPDSRLMLHATNCSK